ncbi:OmpP1/FadL family transporter [Enterovirga aerilata]|uniref:TonB-dependent receptor n=1 Tax=Enterovirga aerilata TaxID=2730920 RepID=A0A849HZI7_9HYPH|nr:outer membrane protein transport protein [Enterovirga sp. DB1703]NNM72946.1 TonB-dependent receptor [Enterovirga sp. DB1703]
MKLGRAFLLGVGSAAVLAGAAGSAHAGAFGLRSQSTIAIGQAYAGAAAGAAGVSSAFWNPATITMHPGFQSEYNFTFVDAYARISPTPPTPGALLALGGSGDIAQNAFVPATYSSRQLTDRIWIGVASAAPFGSVTKPNTPWAGQFYSRSSRIVSLSFAPLVGIKVNDWLSIGGGPIIQYFKVRLNSAGPAGSNVMLEGDDWGGGGTVGVTVTPAPGTVLGVGYRSTIDHALQGTFRTAAAVLPIRVKVSTPDQLTFGVSQAITPDFRLNAAFEWMNWSRLRSPAIRLEGPGVTIGQFPLNYKDGYLVSVGGEYQLNPQWALRAGVGYEWSPIDTSNRSTRLPDTDRVHASVGASYAWNDKLTINASYAHYFAVGNRRIAIAPGNPLFNAAAGPFFADTQADVNLFSLSARYRWDDPKVSEPAPIIRKY